MAAQQLQVLSGRKATSHYRGACSKTRWYWVFTAAAEQAFSIWSARFQNLFEFKIQFGHYLVPIKYSTNPKLGRWVSTQRYHCKLYQEGKPTPMTEYWIRRVIKVIIQKTYKCGEIRNSSSLARILDATETQPTPALPPHSNEITSHACGFHMVPTSSVM